MTTPSYVAARLALLALRSSIGKNDVLEPDRVAVNGAPATSVETAAGALATIRKPVKCDAWAEAGVLAVRCRSLDEADEQELESFQFMRGEDAEMGGFMGWLPDRYGSADHPVLVTGRDDSLVLPVSIVDLWHAAYEIDGVNYSADDVENPYNADEPEYQEAKRLGARAILRFSSPVDSQSDGHSFMLPLSDDATEAERDEVEKYLIKMARMSRMTLEIDPDNVEPEAGQDESPWRRWQRRSMHEHRESLKVLAGEMERFFAGRAVPPEVAEFIAACRRQRLADG